VIDDLYTLFKQVKSGAMTLEFALSEVRMLPDRTDFDEDGIHPLAVNAIAAARAGHSHAACLLWRLVLEALAQKYARPFIACKLGEARLEAGHRL
jgi:hypothetical protein